MKDLDFDSMRKRMVEEQLVRRGISDKRVLEAFRKVPRHKFVADEYLESAYGDFPLPIGDNQTIFQPYMVALMTELLKLGKGSKVLEIGSGSGYQLAILCELAKEVYSVERIDALASRCSMILKDLDYTNFNIKAGDGTLGWQEYMPYDGIVVTAGAPAIPDSLVGQLNEGGRLVIPIGSSFSQMLTVAEKSKDSVRVRQVSPCVFVPLIGKEGWPA